MTFRIAMSSLKNTVNPYVSINAEILKSFGSVTAIPKPKELIKRPWHYFKRFDVLVFNWNDTVLCQFGGKVTARGKLLLLASIAYASLIAKHVVFVRHNHHPHACRCEDQEKAKAFVDWTESLYSLCVVHSGEQITANRMYVPHPLYAGLAKMSEPSEPDGAPGYFLIFGRIYRYKGVHDLLRVLPDDVDLIVAGECEDAAYLVELKELSQGKQVQFRSEYISDEAAEDLVAGATAVVLSHTGSGPIVSGSYFFAAGLGAPVVALENAFLDWLQTRKVPGIQLASDYRVLAEMLSNFVSEPSRREIATFAHSEFGREAVLNAWRSVLERLR